MITEDQVVEAYRRMIQLKVRQQQLDDQESEQQREERLDAIGTSDLLRLQYIAQHAR